MNASSGAYSLTFIADRDSVTFVVSADLPGNGYVAVGVSGNNVMVRWCCKELIFIH